MSEIPSTQKFEMFNQLLTEYCYALSRGDRDNALESLNELDSAVYLGNEGLSFLNGGIVVKLIINLNLIKVDKTLDLCIAIVNGLYPNNTLVPRHFNNAIFSFNSGVDNPDELKCGFFEENDFLGFYVMTSDSAELERSIVRSSQRNRESRENDDPDDLDELDFSMGAFGLSSMCNILEGLHRKITVLERNRS
jgi:hypothetical protein